MTESQSDPIAEEGKRLLREDPQLAADVTDFSVRLNSGEVSEEEVVAHDVARQRLKQLGVEIASETDIDR